MDSTGSESSTAGNDKRLRAIEVVEDTMEEEDEAAEHAHKRGRQQAWRDVELSVAPHVKVRINVDL